jgi:hypothetical protein
MCRTERGQLHDLRRRHARAQRLDDGVDKDLPGLLQSLLSLAVPLARPAERLTWIIHRYTVAPLANARLSGASTLATVRLALAYSAINKRCCVLTRHRD